MVESFRPFIATPYKVNIIETFTMEYTKQVSTLVLHQEFEGFFDFALNLVIDISKATFTDRLDFFVGSFALFNIRLLLTLFSYR